MFFWFKDNFAVAFGNPTSDFPWSHIHFHPFFQKMPQLFISHHFPAAISFHDLPKAIQPKPMPRPPAKPAIPPKARPAPAAPPPLRPTVPWSSFWREKYRGFPPKNGWLIMENAMNMDDF
jgi:hypothetical protein